MSKIKININKIMLQIKKIFSKIIAFIKKRWLILLILFGVILLFIGIFLNFKYISDKKKEKYLLSHFYDVYPEEIKQIYMNMVDISCKGDLYLNIKIDDAPILVNDLDDIVLLDYMFSYMDKNGLLDDYINKARVDKVINQLFYTNVDIINSISNYAYGDYIYNYEDGKIIRKENDKCNSGEIKHYYSQLYGYSYDEKMLSIDISIGFDKDGVLYDLEGKKLGEFKDEYDAQELFALTSYYKYNFVKINGKYKLKSVEWKNKL